MEFISGFSKLTKEAKRAWIHQQVEVAGDEYLKFDLSNGQDRFDQFSENTIANFLTPLGVAPNFLINDKVYCVPMVTEESSVVAAAAKASKFWQKHGGFKAQVVSMNKRGHVYFKTSSDYSFEDLKNDFLEFNEAIVHSLLPLTRNMNSRGGGIKDVKLIKLEEYSYKLDFNFITCDAMGANFINSCLEAYAKEFKKRVRTEIEIIMCILSNYTPECLVKVSVSSKVENLGSVDGLSSKDFVAKFLEAVKLATIDRDRAVTHNKGIMNGIDSVVIATGNDFRAVEACAHSYAARSGKYQSLSYATLDNQGVFEFSLEIPLAVGTVGGLTSLHPLAKFSLDLLESPSAKELMCVIASVGLAQNFGAIRSLITTGIQKGHMKMHLQNILNSLNASDIEKSACELYFLDKVVSYSLVRDFLKRKAQ